MNTQAIDSKTLISRARYMGLQIVVWNDRTTIRQNRQHGVQIDSAGTIRKSINDEVLSIDEACEYLRLNLEEEEA